MRSKQVIVAMFGLLVILNDLYYILTHSSTFNGLWLEILVKVIFVVGIILYLEFRTQRKKQRDASTEASMEYLVKSWRTQQKVVSAFGALLVYSAVFVGSTSFLWSTVVITVLLVGYLEVLIRKTPVKKIQQTKGRDYFWVLLSMLGICIALLALYLVL